MLDSDEPGLMAKPSPETHLPDPLDTLLRDLHLVWCDDDCPPEWHRPNADPGRAATHLASALWNMAEDAAQGSADSDAALTRLNAYVAKASR